MELFSCLGISKLNYLKNSLFCTFRLCLVEISTHATHVFVIYFNYQLILPYLWVIWRMFSSNTFWHSFSILCLRTSIEGHFSCRRSARYLDKCQGYFLFSFSFWLNGSITGECPLRCLMAVSATVLAGAAALVAASAIVLAASATGAMSTKMG